MQNPGQTQILYKPGQAQLTRTKHDPVDLDNLTQFQPWQRQQVVNIEVCYWNNDNDFKTLGIFMTHRAD